MDESNGSNITPEKQLLKLIEDSDNGEIARAKTQYKAKSFFSTGFLKSSFALFKKTGIGLFGTGNELSLDFRTINWILKLGIISAAAYLIIDISASFHSSKNMPNILTQIKTVPKKDITVKEVQSNLDSYSFYAEKIEKRDIFKPYEEKAEEEQEELEEVLPGISPTASSFVSDIEVVGIAWSDEPDVILHDRKVNRTYFLKKGSTFGAAKVIDIFENSIIIEYNGEEIEIK